MCSRTCPATFWTWTRADYNHHRTSFPPSDFILSFGGRWSGGWWWSVLDIPDSRRRRRPQLHEACLIYLTIISLAQTDSASSCRDRCSGSSLVWVSTAPGGPIRKPQTRRSTSEGPEPHPLKSLDH